MAAYGVQTKHGADTMTTGGFVPQAGRQVRRFMDHILRLIWNRQTRIRFSPKAF